MIDLKSMTPEELAAWFREQGEPAFRAKQVFQWLYRGAVSFDEMTDLPKVLRQKLEEHCFLTAPQVARKQVSAQDGTIKYLWRLSDGNCIETVLMRYKLSLIHIWTRWSTCPSCTAIRRGWCGNSC